MGDPQQGAAAPDPGQIPLTLPLPAPGEPDAWGPQRVTLAGTAQSIRAIAAMLQKRREQLGVGDALHMVATFVGATAAGNEQQAIQTLNFIMGTHLVESPK